MTRIASHSAFSLAALGAVLVSSSAHAHFNLTQPPPADSATDGGKGAPPCGPTTASGVVTPMQGGQDLPIDLSETIIHPGHYRVALGVTRDQIPADPAVVTNNGNSVSAAFETDVQPPVLADDLFDHTTGTAPIHWTTTLKVPNINCDKCTLQIIEFMAEHSANPGGGYFYHHCADLKITADPSLPLETWPGASSSGPAAGAAGAGAGGAAGSTSAGASGGAAPTGASGSPSSAASGETASGVGVGATAAAGTSSGKGSATPAATGTGPSSAAATGGATTPATASQPQTSDSGGGCALSPFGEASSAGGLAGLLMLGLGIAARRRR